MHPDHHEILQRVYRDHHQKAARAVAYRNHRRVTDPAVQDAVAVAIERLAGFLARGGHVDRNAEAGWLITTACREYQRPLTSPEARRTRPINEVIEATVPIVGPSPEEDLLRRVADEGVQRALDQALGRLSALQREVLEALAAGLTYREIEERTGLSNTAVSKAIQRARRTLRADGRLAHELREWRG